MCVYSHSHESVEGEVGDKTVVHDFSHGGKFFGRKIDFTQNHPDRGKVTRTRMCPVCISDGCTLSLSNMPASFREELHLNEIERCVFVEGTRLTNEQIEHPNEDFKQVPDKIKLRNGDLIPVEQLPLGIEMEILSMKPLDLNEPMPQSAEDLVNSLDVEPLEVPVTPAEISAEAETPALASTSTKVLASGMLLVIALLFGIPLYPLLQ